MIENRHRTKPLITVIVTTHNRASLLGEALDSVARSNRKTLPEIEVLVVDNNSRDTTRTVVESFQASKAFPFALRYVRETAVGASHARNRGLAEAAGEYVVFMDDDQRIGRNYLHEVSAAFEDADFGCIGGPLKYYNLENLPAWLPALLVHVGQFDEGNEIKTLRPSGQLLRGGNMALRKQDAIDIGGFDTALGRQGDKPLASEETDLQERLHAAGKKIVYHPKLIQYHYLRSERLTKHHWRRNRFYYGRTVFKQDASRGQYARAKPLFNMPRWLLRSLVLRDLPSYLYAELTFKKDRFPRQLRVCFLLGQLAEAKDQDWQADRHWSASRR